MKRTCLALSVLGLVTVGAAEPPEHIRKVTREADMKFNPSKLVPGVSQAVISGDPSKPGEVYVVRNRFSPNTFSPPHYHPETRYITVLKGTWWVGTGPKFDKDATTPVPAGSFVVDHPNQIHWDGAKDEEAVVQIMGVGPSATIRVDESGRPKQ